MEIKDILESLKQGNFNAAYAHKIEINNSIYRLMNEPDESFKSDPKLLDELVDIIAIGNITYNYSDADILPIDDSIYDMLVVKLQRIDYDRFTPGAIPIDIDISNKKYSYTLERKSNGMIKPFTVMQEEDIYRFEDAMFPEIFNMNKKFDPRCNIEKPFMTEYTDCSYVTKRLHNTAHNYPNLVGTLDKCKIVLTKQAEDLGILNQSNLTIFERDFMAPLLQNGLIDPYNIQMVGTLKYDGISIEADCTDEIISARTRGDTDYNLASDLTPILGGYKFPNAPKIDTPIGIKFEAIVLYEDLEKINRTFGKSYINGRTAIIGLIGSSASRKLRDYITLVPIQADFSNCNIEQPLRVKEIEFLNKYYANREYLRWSYMINGYYSLLYMVKRFVDEAEYFRKFARFMYDGVVLEFVDPDVIKRLGRKNSINQYQMAIKFDPLKRVTTFRGFTYTVGQNGNITPMIHYDPIEFLGAIHNKSTGSSYKRFKELNLYVGDQISVTYINDVMPYVDRLDIDYNKENHQREPSSEELFPTHCPCCGTKLILLDKGKTMRCPNKNCHERTIQRMTNMINKLGIKDFSQSAIEDLNVKSFKQLMTMSVDDMRILGPTDSIKLYNQLDALKKNPLPDYRVIGALGFTNIASKTWKLIFSKIPLQYIYNQLSNSDNNELMIWEFTNLKGIGPIIANIIVDEFEFFKEDINYIVTNNYYIQSIIGNSNPKYKIRFSGFRDPELAEVISRFTDIDCDDSAGVTKDTTILLVPNVGAKSTKVDKAIRYGIPIVPVTEFLENPSKYIPTITRI